jgi:hypothetical protein
MQSSTADSPTLTDNRQRGREIWIWWVIAHVVGGLSGVVAGNLIRLYWGNPVYDELAPLQYWAIPFAATSFWLGLAQWAVLRHYLGISAWWVFATTISRGVLIPVGANLFETVLGLPHELFLVSEGLIVGSAQWLVLRSYVAHAGRWIWISAVGIPLSIPIVIGALMPLFGDANQYVWLTLTATVQGAITGVVLATLVRGKTSAE